MTLTQQRRGASPLGDEAMANCVEAAPVRRPAFTWKLLTSTSILCVLSACGPTSISKRDVAIRPVNKTYDANSPRLNAEPSSPLNRATTYWATAFQKNPRDPKAGLSYALNLKALGSRRKALEVLQQAHRHNPSHAGIASEYGRLVLAEGNVKLAQQLLAQASTLSGKPDWRVLSAQGTVHAKLGEHDEAQRFYVAALQQKPDSPSIMNNLALSYAMDGKADEAESLLRRAVKGGNDTPRLRQNLALVLGVQGKFEESEKLGGLDLPGDQVHKNVTYLRNMVKQRTSVAAASHTDRAADARDSERAVPIVPASVRTPASSVPEPAARMPVAAAAAKPTWTASVAKTPTVLKPALH